MFMALAQEWGWKAIGTEIAPHCVTYAREELGLEVYQGDLTQLSLDQQFDVVALNHILEHVADPVAQVQAARAVIREHGLLYVGVPNHRSFDARRQGLEWEGWALPWHFYHYTPTTVRRLLEQCGFWVTRIEFGLSRDYNRPMISVLRRLLPNDWGTRIFSGTNLTVYACIDDRSS
jgi:SAM-dependent methyltransferase